MFQGLVRKIVGEKVPVVDVLVNKDGLVDCDKLTILFGMGQQSRTAYIYFPHGDNQEHYDKFGLSIDLACQAVADDGYNGIWSIWKAEAATAEVKNIENYFKIKVNPVFRTPLPTPSSTLVAPSENTPTPDQK